MASVWLASSLWIGLALISSILSIWIAVSVALVESRRRHRRQSDRPATAPCGHFLAGFGPSPDLPGRCRDRSRGDPQALRSSMTSACQFLCRPFSACSPSPGTLPAGPGARRRSPVSRCHTTSVAVVYAVMVETGFNRTDLGKIILAACFSPISARCWPWGWSSPTTMPGWRLFGARPRRRCCPDPEIGAVILRRVGHRVSEPRLS